MTNRKELQAKYKSSDAIHGGHVLVTDDGACISFVEHIAPKVKGELLNRF